jgi:hypothetical protein
MSNGISAFLRTGPASSLDRVVYSHYGGNVPVMRVLELTLGHAGHHLRQLYWFMENGLHVTPQAPLSEGDWDGIDMPSRLFITP